MSLSKGIVFLRNEILRKATDAYVQVSCKYVVENGISGIRVWRVL